MIMNTLNVLQTELGNLGYSAEVMIRDYTFADVLSPRGEARQVALAVFTQVPESYRGLSQTREVCTSTAHWARP
ncbi:hypothetical protein [Mesorhizobium sophorae]|uniref:hypothetical protein n=1 Tax=Mesorhizobium sophorae TaxID=1300294 RepID=UPI00117D6893|nr:hypothetical protein [Mesorhizobium sophorae]